jgi:hypothetical protein
MCLKDNFLSTKLSALIPGAQCTPTDGDKNGYYSINYDLQCSLSSCKAGYTPDSTLSSCVINSSPSVGDLCVGPDTNATFSYKSNNNGLYCDFIGCKNGYVKDQQSSTIFCRFNPGMFCRFGTDPNGFYVYDEASNCVLQSCNTGYIPDSTNTSCISKYPNTTAT